MEAGVADDAILIGDPKSRRIFCFEIHLKSIRRPDHIATAATDSTTGSPSCFLSYNLFGINITSESFSLLGPSRVSASVSQTVDFEPIRDGFTIRSCLADLVAFFEQSLPVLVIHLQLARQQQNRSADPDDPIIATATVSLRQLARQLALAGDNEDDFAEAEVKGMYGFLENREGHGVAGVSFSDTGASTGRNNFFGVEAEVQMRQTETLPPQTIKVTPGIQVGQALQRHAVGAASAITEPSATDSLDDANESLNAGDDSYASSQHDLSSVDTPPRHANALRMVVEHSPHQHGAGASAVLAQQTQPIHHDEMVGAVHESNLSVVKHFRLSIDLRSVSGMKQATRVFLTYNYPQLGCHTPVKTLPPVLCNPRFEALLPNGFCMFEFAVTGQELRQMLHQWPLVLKLLRSDRYANDSVLGIAEVRMAKVLKSPLYYRCPESAKTFSSYASWQKHAIGLYGEAEARNRRAVEFRSYDRLIDVFATSESGGVSNKVVAKVRTILYIEDLGPADETAVPLQPKATVASQALTHEPEPSRAPETQSHPSLDEAKLKRDLEHDIRSELEREMEEVFKKRLEELEKQWAAKEALRQKEFDLAREESAKLDARVRQAIAEAEKKQRLLAQTTITTKRQLQEKTAELEIRRRKLESESEHKLNLEAERTEALKQRLKLTKDLLTKATERTAQIEEDFQEYKRRQRNTPEAEMQNEIIQLKSEKADLLLQIERYRVDAIQEAANRAELRRQLIELASEVSSLRNEKEQAIQRDMQSLRVQYLAQEQRFVLRGDRSELNHIKEDLDALRSPGGHPGSQKPRSPEQGASPFPHRTVPAPVGVAVQELDDSDEDSIVDEFAVTDDEDEFEPLPGDGGQGNTSISQEDADMSGLSTNTTASVELQRLLRERSLLAGNPSYGTSHPLVRRLDAAIALQRSL